ncbi:CRISPR-associated endonuclease Cas3'' [Frankia sp. AgKG'84/4]|uniref:CRISPR-associated endonuclease Cas3'' n=1 Tax=Frankia sp. AgKG'84/4 TaxID=573490 RepID=UPI0020107F33|nr:CRISPR-associated endonuclease Cas3'' [Frankia sp. AgKG'84/4]MCL9795530.1 CRISPR-associated endonuclease Cas3'' [Frankia sp. AgKG'84/4]
MEWGRLAALWAKTGSRRNWHPLWAHVTDAAAVADWLWRLGLAPSFRRAVGDLFPGGEEDGRLLLCWLAALHDLGKASPAFQADNAARAAITRLNFTDLPENLPGRRTAPHSLVSAAAMVSLLEKQHGWSRGQALWPAVLVGGHHGLFPRRASPWRRAGNRPFHVDQT